MSSRSRRMIKFEGNIVQFGFGAVGKSFFEKLPREIDYNENKYFVITRDNYEFQAYVNLGGIVANFITADVNKENFAEILLEQEIFVIGALKTISCI